MEYAQLQSFMFVLITICGSVVTIAGLVAVVVKFWKWAHKDTETNTATLKEVEGYLASDKRRIEALERGQEEAKEQNKLILLALKSILDHEIDGTNHIDQLKETRDEIYEYLIGHQSK